MKLNSKSIVATVLFGCVLSCLFTFESRGQGTAFTYQGRLNNGGSPASGTYNLTFTLFATNTTGVPIAVPVTNNAVFVTNGLFTVPVDFGPGAFTGQSNWLEIAVQTNLAGTFNTLTPRQQLTPTPYAIFAEGVAASGISGLLTNAQLAHSAVTVDAGPGFSGGGKVTLGNSITLTNTGVLSVTGNADISAVTVGGAVTLGDTATSADTPNLIVKRDGSGNFSAATVTLDGSLNLPDALSAPLFIYSGGSTLLNADSGLDLFVGYGAGPDFSGSGNTGLGFQALSSAVGSFNTAVGLQTLFQNNGGSYNTAVGAQALFQNSAGSDNTAAGYQALYVNMAGENNTAIGANALNSNTGGSYNTASGHNALYSNASGSNNVANGVGALYHNTIGNYNTAAGGQALDANTNGTGNTAVGYQALFSNTGGFVAGYGNTAIGWEALYSETDGADNIALGNEAGYNITTGNANIDIYDGGTASDNGVIRIGTQGLQSKTFIAGIYGTTVSGSTVTVNSSGQLGVAPSSRRFKQDIHSMDDASSVLLSLRPVTFKYRPGIDPQGTPQFGLVAEEVAKVDPELVLRDGKGQIFTVRYDAVNAMLLNEFLKQHRTVDEQSGEIQNLKHQNDSLERRLNELEKAVASVEEKSGATFALNSKATEYK